MKLLADDRKGGVTELMPCQIRWDTRRRQKPGQLTFCAPYAGFEAATGSILRLEEEGRGIFRGQVFECARDHELVYARAYDQLRFLLGRDSGVYEQRTAGELVKALGADLDLNLGEVADTKVKLDMAPVDQKLIDIIDEAAELTKAATGVEYWLWDDDGRLCLWEMGQLKCGVTLGGSIAAGYKLERSLEKSYNAVRLSQKTAKGARTVIEKVGGNKEWGVLRYYDRVDEKLTKAQVSAMAKSLLEQHDAEGRTLTVTGLGCFECRAGAMVNIELPVFTGRGIINSAAHLIEGSRHTMELEIGLEAN